MPLFSILTMRFDLLNISLKLEIVKCQTKAYLTLLELGMVLDLVRNDYPSEYKFTHYLLNSICT